MSRQQVPALTFLEITDIHEATKPIASRSRLPRRMPSIYGSMMFAMASETTIFDPALAERERVLRILRESEAEIRAQGVMRLRMFGSMARGEAGPASDVDLIADIDRTVKFSLLDLVGLQHLLQDLLGREVDVGTTVGKMRPRMRQRFEADAIEVF